MDPRACPDTGAEWRDEGLYFFGMPWQHTRGSALLGWVKDDAEYIAERIRARATATGAVLRGDRLPLR